MAVTVDLAGGTAPSFSEMEAAQDAQVQLGSGAGAGTISSGADTISGGVEGGAVRRLPSGRIAARSGAERGECSRGRDGGVHLALSDRDSGSGERDADGRVFDAGVGAERSLRRWGRGVCRGGGDD